MHEVERGTRNIERNVVFHCTHDSQSCHHVKFLALGIRRLLTFSGVLLGGFVIDKLYMNIKVDDKVLYLKTTFRI